MIRGNSYTGESDKRQWLVLQLIKNT